MSRDDRAVRWARFRFAVVGPLLASPPEPGELGREIERLARRTWKHPVDEHPVRFGASTLERWYYQARRAEKDPVGALAPASASRCRRAAELRRSPGPGPGGAVPRAPRLDGAAARGQPGGAGRAKPEARGDAVVLDGAPLHAPSGNGAPARGGVGKRARHGDKPSIACEQLEDPQLRGPPRTLAVAPRLPRMLALGGDRQRKVGEASAAGNPRRPLAAVLPRPVVFRGDHRGAGARADAGDAKACPAPFADDRQRRGDARR